MIFLKLYINHSLQDGELNAICIKNEKIIHTCINDNPALKISGNQNSLTISRCNYYLPLQFDFEELTELMEREIFESNSSSLNVGGVFLKKKKSMS